MSLDWLRNRLALARSSEAATCMVLVDCDELEALLDLAEAWDALRWAQSGSLDLGARHGALSRGDNARLRLDPTESDS